MTKKKYYYKYKFSLNIIKDAHVQFLSILDKTKTICSPQELTVSKGLETWNYDSFEEFVTAYKDADRYRFDHIVQDKRLIIDGHTDELYIAVESSKRVEIESVFAIFESKLGESVIRSEEYPIKIFIGHGQDNQWRDLKDHLHEQHGFEVNAYEIGPRAGLSVKEVLESMLNESSFALLVLTGEDIDTEGVAHARENVIHELGLFQGRIGFKRAIAVLEKGVNEFSNILGVNQVRFSKGNIKETFGDILSIIKREFKQDIN